MSLYLKKIKKKIIINKNSILYSNFNKKTKKLKKNKKNEFI